VFFRHDRRLFAEISKMIFAMISDFYREVAGKKIDTGIVIAHQSFGDMLRFREALMRRAPLSTFPSQVSRK
jgi:DNA primase catalytic subunit